MVASAELHTSFIILYKTTNEIVLIVKNRTRCVKVTAIPAGNYEDQIDNIGFQSSNVFTNVRSGAHTINVHDGNQFVMISKDEFIVDYPRYFTPNGDG